MNIISDNMEKYCKSCGRVFKDSDFKICPYCGNQLSTRTGRQPIPRKLRHQVFQRDEYRCRECGASKDETSLEIDHIVPVAKGGTNDIDNLQTLCRECNRMKHTDKWVGGETDLEVSRKQLSTIDNQIKQANVALSYASTEEEKIDYKFLILKLNEEKRSLQSKIDQLMYEAEENRKQEEEAERKSKLYKKLYVRFSNEDVYKTIYSYFPIGSTKDDLIIALIEKYSTEENIDNAIEIKKNDLIKEKELKIKKEEMEKQRKINIEKKRNELKIKREEKIGLKFCPHCGKEILKNAVRCKYCHYMFKTYSTKRSPEKQKHDSNSKKGFFDKLFSR